MFFSKKKWVQVCHCKCGAITKLKNENTKCIGCGYHVSTLLKLYTHFAEIKYGRKRDDGTWEFKQQ